MGLFAPPPTMTTTSPNKNSDASGLLQDEDETSAALNSVQAFKDSSPSTSVGLRSTAVMSNVSGLQEGSSSALEQLFAKPSRTNLPTRQQQQDAPGVQQRNNNRSTSSNISNNNNEQTPLLSTKPSSGTGSPSALQSLFAEPPPPINDGGGVNKKEELPSMYEVPIHGATMDESEKEKKTKNGSSRLICCSQSFVSKFNPTKVLKYTLSESAKSSTWIGAFMFSLYHIVFSLTMGSAITRPYGTASMLGIFTKMTSLGIILSSPVFWLSLSDIPALYPTIDLFCAPFIANMAAIVDETLHEEGTDNDAIFLTTFTLLSSFSIFLSATLLSLASVFKLANLGSYLPSAVISGFFACIGVLLWTLAVKIDANGKTIDQVVKSGDSQLIKNTLCHHGVSVVIGVTMKVLGPKSPFFVVSCVLATILLFYISSK